ncbi:MAG: hypothetical protein WBA18_22850 [Terracidiphilus sp.]
MISAAQRMRSCQGHGAGAGAAVAMVMCGAGVAGQGLPPQSAEVDGFVASESGVAGPEGATLDGAKPCDEEEADLEGASVGLDAAPCRGAGTAVCPASTAGLSAAESSSALIAQSLQFIAPM